MLDRFMHGLLTPPLNGVGERLAKVGISANTMTLLGFGIGLLALPAIALQQYQLGLILMVLNRVLDGLDGAIARYHGLTDLGGYLDIVCDFIVYSAFIFGFALAQPHEALWAAFLIFSFMGTSTSFLAYAIIAAKRNITQETKAFYYLGGLTEGTETIAVFLLLCLFPHWFKQLSIIFGCLCWITTCFRMLSARSDFSESGKTHGE